VAKARAAVDNSRWVDPASGVTDLCLRFVGDDQFQQFERITAEVLPALVRK
jgi:hypothetical protein